MCISYNIPPRSIRSNIIAHSHVYNDPPEIIIKKINNTHTHTQGRHSKSYRSEEIFYCIRVNLQPKAFSNDKLHTILMQMHPRLGYLINDRGSETKVIGRAVIRYNSTMCINMRVCV